MSGSAGADAGPDVGVLISDIWHLTSGAVAQPGERLVCIQEVVGSIPSGSTIQMSDDRDQGSGECRLIVGLFMNLFVR